MRAMRRPLVPRNIVSKGAPLAWLRHFLEMHSPDCKDKCVCVDQGGEPHKNPEVHKLFTEFHCDVKPKMVQSNVANFERGGCWRTRVTHDRRTVFSDEQMPDLGGS